jgi:hypothetical protein
MVVCERNDRRPNGKRIMSRPKNLATPKTRFNLDLTDAARARLGELKVRLNADSLVEVIRTSLAVYESLLDCVDAGGEVVLRVGGKEKILLLVK